MRMKTVFNSMQVMFLNSHSTSWKHTKVSITEKKTIYVSLLSTVRGRGDNRNIIWRISIIRNLENDLHFTFCQQK